MMENLITHMQYSSINILLSRGKNNTLKLEENPNIHQNFIERKLLVAWNNLPKKEKIILYIEL